MLTKSDLSNIRKIIREEIETESKSLRDNLQAEIKLARMEHQSELRDVKSRLKNIEINIGKIQKDMSVIINFFDKEFIGIHKRVERIEQHLGLTSSS